MITTNLWRRLRQLIPEAPLLIGTVQAVDTYDVVVALPDGGLVRARGSAALGARVFVRDGVLEGTAPNLTVELIEI